jgi:hypothetical protein
MTVYVTHAPDIIQSGDRKLKKSAGLFFLEVNQKPILIADNNTDPLYLLKKLKSEQGFPKEVIYFGFGLSKNIAGPNIITSYAQLINEKVEPLSDNFIGFESGTCLAVKDSKNSDLIEDLLNGVDCIEDYSSRWFLSCEALDIDFRCIIYSQHEKSENQKYKIEQKIQSMLDFCQISDREKIEKKSQNKIHDFFERKDFYWTKSLKSKFEKQYEIFLKNNDLATDDHLEAYISNIPETTPKKRALNLVGFLERGNNPEFFIRLDELNKWMQENIKDPIRLYFDPKLEDDNICVSFKCKSDKNYNEQVQRLSELNINAFFQLMHDRK